MTAEHDTVLPATVEQARAHLRSAAAELAQAEHARGAAVGAVREPVMAARVMKVPWDAIGRELGVSRQAAAERFGGEVRAQLVSAWYSIETLLARVAAQRGYPERPTVLLARLGESGDVPAELATGARRLYEAQSRAVHSPTPELTATDADQLTDVAVPLNGILWLMVHGGRADADASP